MIRRLVLDFARDRAGAAAAEIVLILPLALTLAFTALEAGHFIWTQHKIVEAVRDGARYAGRLEMSKVCPETGSRSATIDQTIRTITRTGKLQGTVPVVPGWDDGEVTVTYSCGTYLNTGIYSTLNSAVAGGNGATVTVASTGLTYTPLFKAFNILTSSIRIGARSSTPVIGL